MTTALAVTTALGVTIALGGCAPGGNAETATASPSATHSEPPAVVAPLNPAASTTSAPDPTAQSKPNTQTKPRPLPEPKQSTSAPLPTGHDDPASLDVLVNKQHPLNPVNYVPAELSVPQVQLATSADAAQLRPETARAAEEMFAAAAAEGVGLTLVSGYRSYGNQVAAHHHWITVYGSQQGADTVSARPGYSEHQTGLSLDIGQVGGACTLAFCFGDTAAGAWTAKHAHEFGFVVRYPPGEHDTTGYHAESWHFRYVGRNVSTDMHSKGILTLEEQFGFRPAPNYL